MKKIISALMVLVILVTLLPQVTIKAKAHTIVMTAEEFVDCLWTAYSRPNYYYNSYPYNLGYYDGSRISFDCWNLGKAIIWTKGAIVNNYTVGKYAAMDSSCGLGDWDGLSIIREAPNCSSDFSNLVPGEWLYMDNHTGYYVGDGQVIECTAGWNVWAITVSQIDSSGRRSRNGVSGGSWKLRGMVPWLDYSSTEGDEEPPVISDVTYSELSATGYTVSCKVTDNHSVKRVAFPTWTAANGQDDLPAQFMSTQQGTKNGDTYTFRVNASDHNNEQGAYITHIYAEDRAGNITSTSLGTVQVRNDNSNPVISDVKYTNLSKSGYTVSCKVTDDLGVHSVSFPTWTVHNGQDDLPEQFLTTQLGTKNGDIYTFRVNASDHNNEQGAYVTHIYATDYAGNRVSCAMDVVHLMDDTQKPVITDVVFSNITPAGYTVSCKVTDNLGVEKVAFPTWTTEGGQDDLDHDFMINQLGTRSGNTYTFQVKTSAHKNEMGYYVTHIYAVDTAGNVACYEAEPILIQDKPSKIKLLSTSGYAIENGYLQKVTPATPVALLLEQFENEDLIVQDKSGNIITDSEFVGTGCVIQLYDGTKLKDTVMVIILGDLDGNGVVDTTDYMRIKSSFVGSFDMDEAENLAADVDQNDIVDNTDYMRIKAYFLGTYDFQS